MSGFFKVLLVLALLLAPAWGEPLILPPAPFSLNDMTSLCEVNHGGRVVLRYDVRALGGRSLRLQLFPGKGVKGKPADKAVREFTFAGPTGTQRLDLKGLPILVYRVQGTPLDAAGQPLGGGERPVYLCWGGGRAWRAFDMPTREASSSGDKTPFQEVGGNADLDGPSLEIDPPGVVVNQGQSAEIKAHLRGMGQDQELEWKFEGSGQFRVIDNLRATYTADKKAQMGSNGTIRVVCKSRPELRANVTVLVTSVRSSEIQK